jgi:hypothetical protein
MVVAQAKKPERAKGLAIAASALAIGLGDSPLAIDAFQPVAVRRVAQRGVARWRLGNPK